MKAFNLNLFQIDVFTEVAEAMKLNKQEFEYILEEHEDFVKVVIPNPEEAAKVLDSYNGPNKAMTDSIVKGLRYSEA